MTMFADTMLSAYDLTSIHSMVVYVASANNLSENKVEADACAYFHVPNLRQLRRDALRDVYAYLNEFKIDPSRNEH